MLSEGRLAEIADLLAGVPGVVGVVLGGSRARGEHRPDSDVDLGLAYRPPLDVTALGQLGHALAGPSAQVTHPGGWGPWVDGGGWLTVEGTAVDWIYRDVDRVRTSVHEARAGRFTWNVQTGHPLGFPSHAYAGELALCRVLADPTGELRQLQRDVAQYPPALRDAVVGELGEAEFLLGGAAKVVERGDSAYVAGCLFRVLLLCAHALHAAAGRWVVNEKGAVTSAGRLPLAPRGFADRVQAVFADLGSDPAELRAALAVARALVAETITAVEVNARPDPPRARRG